MGIECGQQWGQFLTPSRWNWLNVYVIAIEPEWDRALGQVTCLLALAGFWIRLTWEYDGSTELRKKLHAQLDELDAKSFVSVPVKEYERLTALDGAK